MIVFLTALAVHTEDISQLGSRLSVIVAMFLTCFAIQWVILDRLPRVPYLTILDSIIFDAIGALGLMLVGACAAHKIAYPDGFFYHNIVVGKNLMPAFGYKLTPKQTWDIVNYLRKLQGKA